MDSAAPSLRIVQEEQRLIISGALTKESVPLLFSRYRRGGLSSRIIVVDLNGLSRIDTTGVACLEWIREHAEGTPRFSYEQCSKDIVNLIEQFFVAPEEASRHSPAPSFFERLGGRLVDTWYAAGSFLVLTAEIFFWSAAGIFKTSQRRAHSVLEQCWFIGVQSLPLVALLSIILGVILSLQSAIQLRTFGANIYVADLMAISIVNEMGPMMSAILIAGRSGSAIASEVATMKVSEEIEALQVMGIEPIRYVVVPKFLAITMTIPLLVGFAIYLGIGGGVLVGAGSLEIAPQIFIARAAEAVGISNIIKSLVKSILFGWLIVIIGSYFGFSVSGGAEEVGRATTMAVVYSIISIIILDALFSLTAVI